MENHLKCYTVPHYYAYMLLSRK